MSAQALQCWLGLGLKRHCYQEENGAKQRRSDEITAQHDQESRTVNLLRDQVRRLQERLEFIEDSRIFKDPDPPSSSGSAHVSYEAHITSSSRMPSREPSMQRNTRKDMSIIPGNVLYCQSARLVPEELHNASKNLATPSGILRREVIVKGGSNGTCTQSGMTIPSNLLRRCIWENSVKSITGKDFPDL